MPRAGIEPAQPYGREIFVTLRLSTPAFAVCALDYAFTLARGFRCPPSSLYTFPCGLGSALPRHAGRGFAEFEGIHAGAFTARCSIF